MPRFICEILRPIPGVDAKVGDVVDVTEWPNRELLIEQRFLRERQVGAASSDGDAALRAQVAELEGRVAAQGKRLAALEKALGVEAEGTDKSPGRKKGADRGAGADA